MRPHHHTFRSGHRPRPVPVYDLLTPGDLIDAEQHWALAPAGFALAPADGGYAGFNPDLVLIDEIGWTDEADDDEAAPDLRSFSSWPAPTLWQRLASLACTPPLTPREVLLAILVGAIIVSSGVCR